MPAVTSFRILFLAVLSVALAPVFALTATAQEGPAATNAPSATPGAKARPDAALNPSPATIPPKGAKADSSIEISGPDNGGEAQLYRLGGDARAAVATIRLSSKIVVAKCYHAKDGSGWIVYEEKAYFYDTKKETLVLDKFGDKNTACLTFDSEKRVTTRSLSGDSFAKAAAVIRKGPPETAAAEADGLKTFEQQITDAATEAWQFSANTLVPYMEKNKSGTLPLED